MFSARFDPRTGKFDRSMTREEAARKAFRFMMEEDEGIKNSMPMPPPPPASAPPFTEGHTHGRGPKDPEFCLEFRRSIGREKKTS